jgi:L-rhamnose mutarotase
MQKVAFTMQLKPGHAEEYQKRHDEIWPELSALLKENGIYDYSIFLDETTGILFGVQKLEAGHTAHTLPQKNIMKKWWTYMADIMETNADHSPVVKSLKKVFHLD